MSPWFTAGVVYLTPVLLLIGAYYWRQRRRSLRSLEVFAQATDAGLAEPASLHPVIDNTRCLGCATCVAACPEKEVLGIAANRARLIKPASCIGHGACKAACPTGAIQLVFGTATRGVDIPYVGADFQTNIEGIYIAGELGGMGLIRNAIEQGRQAMQHIAKSKRRGAAEQFDVIIVGAGPAGISAALAASELGLSYRVLEQDSIGGTIAHYPRGKIVMTAPANLPVVGEFQFGETSKETLIDFWHGVVQRAGIDIRTGYRVENIHTSENGFLVDAGERFAASNILLAIGRRGTPRKLGVDGEDLPKVVYRLLDAEQYRGQRVVVVGGSDSALEAATSLAEEPGTEVMLSYRGKAFNRAKAKNRERVEAARKNGSLCIELESTLETISADHIKLNTTRGQIALPNDAVIICAGGILPTALLESIGIEVSTHHGIAV